MRGIGGCAWKPEYKSEQAVSGERREILAVAELVRIRIVAAPPNSHEFSYGTSAFGLRRGRAGDLLSSTA